MAREKLTDKRVSKIKAPASGRLEIFDIVKTGLCFRITSAGARSWSVMYRHDGHFRRQTLGQYPKISLAKARQLAGQVLETSGQGTDPREAKAQEKAEAAARAADTLDVIADQFVAKYASQRRWGEFERILRVDIKPEWGDKPITGITRRDVIGILDTIAERAPVQANRTLVVLKVFFGWCLDRDIIDADPTARVKKPTKEKSRERVLSDPELRAFWAGCGRLGWPFGDIFKLLALTAVRKSGIARGLWPEIDKVKRVIEIPGFRIGTKTGKPHVVPLPASAIAIIEQLPMIKRKKLESGELAPPHIFTTNGKTPVSGFSKAKTELDGYMLEELRKGAPDPDAVTLAPWIVHDLRRTCRTNLSALGVSADIGERILGHEIPGIRGVYDMHEFLKEKREALDRWAAYLHRVVGHRPMTAGQEEPRLKK